MAGQSSGKAGVIVGIAVGVLLSGVLVASPFYLPMFRDTASKSEHAVAEQVEGLRRAVLALDEHLAVIADASSARGESPDVTAKSDAMFPASVRSTLEDTAKLLRAAEEQDRTRGTVMTAAGRIQSGLPNAKAASNELRTKHIAAHLKVLTDTEAMLRSLSSAEGARDSLGAARVQALMAYAKARINRNRAAFERWQAGQYRDMALDLAGSISDVRIRIASAEARMPTEAIADTEARIEQLDKQLGVVSSAANALKAQISERTQEAEQLEREAAEARTAMAAYSGSTGGLPPDYQVLSDKARGAEARAMAVMNGTLDDAVALQSESGEIEPPRYKGGSPRVGVRDLEFQLAAVTEQLETIQGIRKGMGDRLDEMKQAAQQHADEKDVSSQTLSSLTTRCGDLMAESSKHDDAAKKVEEAALKLFADTGRLAKQAAALAATRTRDASADARKVSETTPDERLTRVAADGDTEGSMYFLAAESSYHAALLHFGRMRAAVDRAVAANVLAGEIDDDAGSADVTEIRKAARVQLSDAVASFKKASTAIGKTKADSISGKNYLWPVQVGEAAVHMLLAAISEGAEEVSSEQKLAYDLLREAAKGREQSPLLAPALDALEFIQRSAG